MESSYQHIPQNPDDSCDRPLGDYPDDDSLQSGGYDGYNYREYRRPADSLKGKLEQKYWKGKQTVIEKFGKSQDVFVVAGDAEVDARLEAFRQIQKTCIDLLKAVEIYQKKIFVLSQEENESGRFLREQGSVDKTKAGKMMISVGKSLSYTAQQRLTLRVPLVRLFQEVETFHHRAVGDTWQTVNRMERLRSEYRAALLWMADISKQLDPEEYRKLDKYREVQSEVKVSKKKFDKCKVDVIQKVDLLSASRCNLLSSTLVAYQQSLLKFWENTSASLTKVYEQFRGHPSYQFQMLKHIIPDDSYTRENDVGDDDIKEERITEEVHVDEKEQNGGSNSKKEAEVGTEVKEEDDDDDTLISLNSSLQDTRQEDDVGMLDLLGNSPPKTEPAVSKNNLNQSSSAVIQGIDDLLGLNADTDSDNVQLPSFTSLTDADTIVSSTNGASGEHGDFLTADDLLFNSPTKPSLSDTIDDGSSFTETWNKMFGDNNDTKDTTIDMKTDETMESPTNYLPSDLIDNFDNLDPFSPGPSPPSVPLSNQPLTGDMTAPSQAMTSPNIPTQQQGTTKPNDGNLATWLNLFSDLDPLSNPDAIGQNNQENDAKRSC